MRKIFLSILFILCIACMAWAEPKAAQDASQYITVSVSKGSNAEFNFYERDVDNNFKEIMQAKAYIGKKGLGKTREGDMKTPVGVFHFTEAFGILPDPGSKIGYTQVDGTHYWVGDSSSSYYNKFVSTRDYDDFNKKDSEHIIDYNLAYKYVLNISYNEDGKPGLGSAIFLHCQTKNKFTGGCVAIPENIMREVVKRVNSDCIIIIDKAKNINNY